MNLEKIAHDVPSLTEWRSGVGTAMKLADTDKERGWLDDEDLRSLFSAEALLPEEQRLSASIGKGLW